MQQELSDAVIIGVNEEGRDSANDSITDGRDLPWLQDTIDADMWNTWAITYRDVLVLDGEGAVIGAFNLTDQSLGDQVNYDTLLGYIEGS